MKFNSTEETPLERIESVDMLRVIESGGKVRMVMTDHESIGVDTVEHLERVEKLMENDSLMKSYL
jgi:3-deoxy-manno-octulosonate cytidylyltransferase (CMP-KDO synthetase)